MNKKVKELISEINKKEEDAMLLVAGFSIITLVPPMEITAEGRERFKSALETEVDVMNIRNNYLVAAYDDEGDENTWDLLSALAGNCSKENYHKWFRGVGRELI